MLNVFLDEGVVAESRKRIPKFPGGTDASRAPREPRVTYFDQRTSAGQYVLNVLASYSDHSLFRG